MGASGAAFLINGTDPSTGGFDATSGQALTLQLKASPALDVTSCTYSVVSSSPNAPVPIFSNSGVASPPTAVVTMTMPSVPLSSAHTYQVQCQTNDGAAVGGPTGKLDDFSVNTKTRVVAIRNYLGLRKMFVGESVEYEPNGWVTIIDALVDQVGAMGSTTTSTSPKTLNANNAPANVAIFNITGIVSIDAIYGVVTSTIGANHTGSKFRSNDQTAQIDLSTAAASPLSGAPPGTLVLPDWTGASDQTSVVSAAAAFVFSFESGARVFEGYIIGKKNGATTTIEYHYVTTDAPASGGMQFFCVWKPVSADGAVTAL